MLSANAELARKLEALEKKYNAEFRVVFDAPERPELTPFFRKGRPMALKIAPLAQFLGRGRLKGTYRS